MVFYEELLEVYDFGWYVVKNREGNFYEGENRFIVFLVCIKVYGVSKFCVKIVFVWISIIFNLWKLMLVYVIIDD